MTNKTPWTPGPWRIGDAGFTVFGPKTDAPAPRTVATLVSHGERAANAQLITLAPEMAEALRAALSSLEYAAMVLEAPEKSAFRENMADIRSTLSRLPVAK